MKTRGPRAAEVEQLQAENEELREAMGTLDLTLNRYADHYDGAPLGLLTVDGAGMIRELNQEACALLKVGRRQALGTMLQSLVSAADQPVLATHLGACRAEGVARARVHLQRPDETILAVELLSRQAGPEERRYVVTTLVPAGAAAEAREGNWPAVATELDRSFARTELPATISDELRAPLTPLLAAVSALEQQAGGSAEVWKLCEIIRRQVHTQVGLIDDLLDATRISRGKLAVRREPAELHTVLREAVEQMEPALRARQIQLAMSLEAQRCLVDGDPMRLRQVFTNLLGNAIKFTAPGGSISVRSWEGAELVLAEVADSGLGIAPESLPGLFAPFEPAGSRAGLGLGLAISKGIIELHQGRISAASAGPGQGARFVVQLPLLRSSPVTQANGQPGARILLVEDDADTAAALILALGAKGYRVHHADSTTAALRADLTGIDLVLSDLRLADGDGRSLLKQLRAGRAIPAIALSGYGASGDRQASAKAGFIAHLTKPVELALLTKTIERALAEQRRG